MTSRRKYNIVAHPKATRFVIDRANPFRTLEVRAEASVDDDPDLDTLAPTHIVAQG